MLLKLRKGMLCNQWKIFYPALGLMLLATVVPGIAQEFDAIVTEHNQRPSTIGDQITNRAERTAYIALFKKRQPAETARLADEFLSEYPSSWELAQVYAIAARAYINLGNYARALGHANQSLQLYPENPLLLVLVANVQTQVGHWSTALRSAQDALEYLHQFTHPSSIPERAWPQLQRELEASCYFAIGRSETGQAFRTGGNSARTALLQSALASLYQARALNPRDTEIDYLLGVVDLGLNRLEDAAVSFAPVAGGNGPLKAKALDHLQRLYAATAVKPAQGFAGYLKHLSSAARDTTHPPAPSFGMPRSQTLPGYAGSRACRPCHSDIYTAWSQTGMANMFRPYQSQNVLGDFTSHNQFFAGDGAIFQNGQFHTTPGKDRWLFARMVVIHGRHYFETRNNDGHWHQYPVDYTIGSKWEQAYATRLPDGEMQIFPIQYNRLLGKWVDFWAFIDPPDSPRGDLRRWGEMGIWTEYQANCAVCHTSQLRNPVGGGFAPKGVSFLEPGVNCEMCHGPCARHVAAMLNGQPYAKRPIDPPVDFSRISARDFVSICSQCHMQSAVRTASLRGELNYSTLGEFFLRHQSRPYDEFSNLGFYKDGRFRQTTFIVESLMRSKCFRDGHVTCGNCHDVHGPNATSNPKSLKFPEDSDLMCIQCHVGLRNKVALARHTHHPYASEGSRCVSFHMPRIMNALLFMARTHRIDDTPNVENTLRFGQADSPSACLLCHPTKDARWVGRSLTSWREGKQVSIN
jgi:tetratricopeptide (TPR) repeat protein